MKKVFLILSTVLFFACGTLDKEKINNPDIRVQPDNLNLKMDYDAYKLRVDLVRMEKPKEEIEEDTSSEDKLMLYHNIGVRFGNGIFLDYNGNLGVDLIEFYNIDEDYFRLVKNKAGGFKDYIFTRNGEDFSMVRTGLFNVSETVLFMEDEKRIRVSSAAFGTGMDIIWTDKKILASVRGFNAKLKSAGVFKISDLVYQMSDDWNKYSFVKTDNKTITYGDKLTITREDDQIVFRYSGLFGSRKTYWFFRTENGFYFYDKDFQGVRAEKKDDVISVYENERLKYTVTIEG